MSAASLGVPVAARFADTIGDIGRGVGCTLVLPDPDRGISRKQALVTWQGGRHFIRPIGSNLDIELNGRLLLPDIESPLDIGAELRIGPYVMRVEPGRGEPAPKPAAAAAPRREDPLAIFGAAERPARGGVFDDLLKSASPATPGLAGVGALPRSPARPPGQRPGAAPAPARPGAVPDRPPTPKVAPEAGRAPRAAVPQVAVERRPGDASRSAAVEEMIAALYEGLGIAPPAQRSPQHLRLIGELLRDAVAGTLELLAARTIAKREMGAGATLLQTKGNNPLKFSPNVDAALTHLLGPPTRGFIAPRASVRDAFGDLRAHQFAVLAGMRAALDAVLARFNPTALEGRLAPKAMWDNLLPVNRRAKLWEQYGEEYAEILREVEDDFDALFGRAFLQAYQAQLQELARGADPPVDE